MARKTRRRGKGGKGVRGTSRVRRVRRVIRGRISRGRNRRYNSEGGISLDETLREARAFGTRTLEQASTLANTLGSQASALGSRVTAIGSQKL